MSAAMTTKSSRPTFRIWVLAAGTIVLFFIVLAFFSDVMKSPLEYAHSKAQEFCESPQESFGSETKNCQDPYRRPGFLVIPPDDEAYRETAWMPFTDKFLNAKPPKSAAYPPQQEELIFNDTAPPKEFLKGPGIPQDWMRIATEENKRRLKAMRHIKNPTADDFTSMKDDAGLGWLWGRRLVEFGDSVDRYEAKYVCHEFGSEMVFPPIHPIEQWPKGICEMPAFNLTFVVFHSAGGFTYRPDWFWYKQMRIIPFEERWEKLWKPHSEPIKGPNGRPDLVLWQNGLWDQRGFQVGGQKNHKTENTTLNARHRKMVWDELRFYTARLDKFAKRINAEFPDTPMMFRTLTVHQKTGMGDVMLIEMDRLGRAIAERYGNEIFEWGRVISLLGKWYSDGTHPAEGALSWLWGNMILEYLARSAGAQVGGDERYPYFEGWDACHEELLGWGGR